MGDGPAAEVAAAGGEFTVTIATTSGCAWTAVSSSEFITTAGNATGAGNGSVKFIVAANTGALRQGAVQVANRAITVTQTGAVAGCEFSITPAQSTVSAAGGSVSVTVTRTSGTNCGWTAASNNGFITVQSGASGTDNGASVLTIAPNAGTGRSGTATIAGRIVTISQPAPTIPCVFGVTPATVSMPSAGGLASIAISVTSGSNCAWTATSNSGFITVMNAAGIGPGSTSIDVGANSGTGRTGSITVGGQVVTVNQSGFVPPSTAIAVLSYQSEPGDFVGGGVSNSFTFTGSQFQVELDGSQSELRFRKPVPGFTELKLLSPSGPLAPGIYDHASRASFPAPGTPGLSFETLGHGCNRVTGRFLVQTAVFSGTDVQRFHARFEQYCEGWSTPLRGQIWIDAGGALPPSLADFPTPPATPITQVTYTSDPGDFIGAGQSGSLTLSGLKAIAWGTSNRPAVEIGMQSATGAPTTNWQFDFSAASGAQLQPGTYSGATRYPFNSGVPGLSVTANSRGCNTVTGSFVVLEAVYGPQGEVLRFHATFEQHCDGAVPALRGEVRIVADPWR